VSRDREKDSSVGLNTVGSFSRKTGTIAYAVMASARQAITPGSGALRNADRDVSLGMERLQGLGWNQTAGKNAASHFLAIAIIFRV
jgi:hypothetical protein